jgi:pyrimidine deaminase RibD-like protein
MIVIINEILTVQFKPREEFDNILAELCELVIDGQEEDSNRNGMVGACVLGPKGQKVMRTSYKDGDKYVHAERAAIDAYGDINSDCTIITTLSPCNQAMDDRAGESCQSLIDDCGITKVYCGYKDPSQEHDTSTETSNLKIKELCKKFADTFLSDNHKESTLGSV